MGQVENISKTKNIMTEQMERRAAGKIFGRKTSWGEKSRMAEELGIQLCSLSNFLHGRGGLSADKVEAVFQRARELQQKDRAHQLIKLAIAKGNIVRPERCESCGALPRRRALDGHHEDYSRPLDVIWLCHQCHRRMHARKNRMPENEPIARPVSPNCD